MWTSSVTDRRGPKGGGSKPVTKAWFPPWPWAMFELEWVGSGHGPPQLHSSSIALASSAGSVATGFPVHQFPASDSDLSLAAPPSLHSAPMLGVPTGVLPGASGAGALSGIGVEVAGFTKV